MNKLLTKGLKFCKKYRKELLLGGTLLAYGSSLYFTGKTAIAVNNIVDDDTLTNKEKRKEIAKESIPAGLSIIATVGLIVVTYVTGRKEEARLLAVATGSSAMLKKYRDKVKEYVGETEEDIFNEMLVEDSEEISLENLSKPEDFPSEGEDNYFIFYEPVSRSKFYATKEYVLLAENETNRTFILRGEVSLSYFLKCLGIDDDRFEGIGWECLAGEEQYGYSWIDFVHKMSTDKNGNDIYVITYPFPPHNIIEEDTDFDRR